MVLKSIRITSDNSFMHCARPFTAEPEKASGILVVDDDLHVLKFVSKMLGSLGHREVYQAPSAEAAHTLFAANESAIGLVITDFVMPNETGDKMALRMQRKKAALKVLVISGNDPMTLDSDIPLEPGLNFLQKPFTVVELRKSIESLSLCD